MRPATKVLLGTALSLLVVGGALNAVGAAMGGREESRPAGELYIGGERGIHLSPGKVSIGGWGEKDGFSDDGTAVILSPFTDLEVSVDLADISVVEGENYAVDLIWESDYFKLSYQLKDGKLRIWNEAYDGDLDRDVEGACVIVTLPDGAELGEVDISTDLGSVTWEAAASARKAELSTDLGSVTCGGLLARELEGSSDLGSVEIFLPGSREEFRWELEANIGQLSLDGEPQSSGMGELLVAGGAGERLVKASSDLGSVDVSFS